MRAGTIVVGLGNPILGDDGIGWRVADEVERRLGAGTPVTVERAALGGLSLMERLVGYEAAVIVDAVHTGVAPVGTVSRCAIAALARGETGHTASAHDVSFVTALAVGRAVGAALPESVEVVGIEIAPTLDVSEDLTPAVAASIPAAAATVLESLGGPSVGPTSKPQQEERNHGVP
jgi:hydrogenase maturation protease